MKTTTIIHISVSKRIAVVTYNGIARMFRLHVINPLDLITEYRKRGYKYSWLTADTILLTKKVSSLQGVKAA